MERSAFIPNQPVDEQQKPEVKFDVLAKMKGWTPEQLRRSYDLPKSQLPPGTKIIRFADDLVTDLFKNTAPSNAEYDFQTAEENFYAKLKRVVILNSETTQKSANPSKKTRGSPKNTDELNQAHPEQAVDANRNRISSHVKKTKK